MRGREMRIKRQNSGAHRPRVGTNRPFELLLGPFAPHASKGSVSGETLRLAKKTSLPLCYLVGIEPRNAGKWTHLALARAQSPTPQNPPGSANRTPPELLLTPTILPLR